MGFLDDLIAQAKGQLNTRDTWFGRAKDAVKHDLYDAHLYEELVQEAPALAEMINDLGQKYDYTDDMVRDVLMEFWQSEPDLREQREMDTSRLANHAVATDIDVAPETKETRGFTRHDRYGSAMATIAVTEKIKETLENLPDDLEQQAKDAEEKQQQAEQAQSALSEALAAAMQALGMSPGGATETPGQGSEGDGEGSGGGDGTGATQPGDVQDGAGGHYDGEGPLTEDQDQAAAALAAAMGEMAQSDQEAREAIARAQELAAERGVRLQQPIAAGIREAGEELAREEDLFSHWGVEDGELQKMDFETRKRLKDALENNRISEFMRLVGRWRMMVQAEHMHHVEFGRDEAYDVELSDRMPDVLGSELVKMINRHTRLDFLNRLADRQLLSRKYRGKERIGRGALIFVGDVSGSMKNRDKHGITREAWLKAMLLAMLLQAKLQRRDFVVILFSSTNQQHMWRFPKGQASIWEVIEVVQFFWNGGTDFMRPLDMATDVLEEDFNREGTQRADIIFATDDDAAVTSEWLRKFQARREKLDFRVFGIAIGCYSGTALKAISTAEPRDVMDFANPHDMVDLVRSL